MTESQVRNLYVTTAQKYLGCKESDGTHKPIIDLYNTQSPLPRGYKVQYTDEWCATFVSAIAVECGFLDIVFPECSCNNMIKLFKNAGRWEESDKYTPKPGDLIMYDWEDSGSGDNTGRANHVGIVVSCTGSSIKIIEGNKSQSVAYRTIKVNGRYIRGFCLPDFASKVVEDTSNAKRIWDYLLDKLGNEYGVAGLMGNLEKESGLYPDRVQGDIPYSSYSQEYTAKVDSGEISEYDFVHNGPGGGGYGLAQWTYSTRKQGLYDMWKSGGYSSIGSLELALDYLWYELNKSYSGVVSVLKSATSVREASDKVLHDFEKPANHEGNTAKEEEREALGLAWYNKYSGSAPGTPTPTPGTPWKPSNHSKMPFFLLLVASQRRVK